MAKISVTSNVDQVFKELNAELTQYQKGIELQVFRALTVLEAEIIQNLRVKSGLHVRTGNLINSIGPSKKVTVGSDGAVTGQIGSQGVKYAAVHEFGGTTRPHLIEPRNAKALKFKGSGGDKFAKYVNHPGSVIPARPYLAPALETKREEILKSFGLYIKSAFKTGA